MCALGSWLTSQESREKFMRELFENLFKRSVFVVLGGRLSLLVFKQTQIQPHDLALDKNPKLKLHAPQIDTIFPWNQLRTGNRNHKPIAFQFAIRPQQHHLPETCVSELLFDHCYRIFRFFEVLWEKLPDTKIAFVWVAWHLPTSDPCRFRYVFFGHCPKS